jgi:hypothetical protein
MLAVAWWAGTARARGSVYTLLSVLHLYYSVSSYDFLLSFLRVTTQMSQHRTVGPRRTLRLPRQHAAQYRRLPCVHRRISCNVDSCICFDGNRSSGDICLGENIPSCF